MMECDFCKKKTDGKIVLKDQLIEKKMGLILYCVQLVLIYMVITNMKNLKKELPNTLESKK